MMTWHKDRAAFAALPDDHMSAAPPSPDAAILSKLDAAELRIGMIEDAKLAKLLDPALCNILGFLSSTSAAVRQKVMGILSHLNKRLKADASIALPLGGLVKLFTADTSAPRSQSARTAPSLAVPRRRSQC